ncbi:MAG: hypothetical protein DME46_05865 [Verrucomicrobia bacterium]|nr:MAG: hypothetical protein DME46_05865 [Verrucomicrobiota bacterium]
MNSTIFGGHRPPLQKSALSKIGWKAPRELPANVKPRISILRPMLMSSVQARTLIAHNLE